MRKREQQDEKLMYEIAQENKRMSEPLRKARQVGTPTFGDTVTVSVEHGCESEHPWLDEALWQGVARLQSPLQSRTAERATPDAL